MSGRSISDEPQLRQVEFDMDFLETISIVEFYLKDTRVAAQSNYPFEDAAIHSQCYAVDKGCGR